MKCKDCKEEGCPDRCYTEEAECVYLNPPIQPCFGNTFNWQSFRAEAAKDILCATISNEGVADERNVDDFTKDNQVKDAVLYADKLISKLKEKEGK